MTAGFQLNAFDPNALGDLKRLARTEGQSNDTLRAAAKQFEALFLQMVMKSMRAATPASGLIDNEQSKLYQSLLDQQLALNLAQAKGAGMADVIYRQIGGKGTGVDVLEALGTGNSGPSEGFDLAGVIRRAAIPAARGVSAESAAAGLLAGLPGRGAAGPLGALGGQGGAFDAGSIVDNAMLEAKLGEAIRSARDTTGAVTQRARDFVADVWPHAVEASRKTGIPPQFMVAQAALETGWGQKQLRHADGSPSHNLFNIKAGSAWTGRTVDLPVTEFAGSRSYIENARFRSYGSYAESFRDYADLLTRSPRYADVLGQTDAAGFARGLQQAGYATDPMYADKLTRIIGGSTLRIALAQG